MAPVRPAVASDIPALARLHVAAWRLAYRRILSQQVLDALSAAEFERIWSGLLRDRERTTLVACPDPAGAGAGEPGGFVAFRLRPEPEIIGLYVDPSRWRRGIGSLLMGEALGRMAAAGARRVVLWVMRDNDRARSFYERSGFSLTGGRRENERQGSRFEELEYAKVVAAAVGS